MLTGAAPSVTLLGVNQLGVTKLCDIEDFTDPELVSVIRRISGSAGRQADQWDWLGAMAVRGLLGSGALGADATVLAVGAGVEPVLSLLADRVGDVSAADWPAVDPQMGPDGAFDAVVCGPIEGVHGLGDVAVVVEAMGRMLKVGGVLSLSTRFRLHGPPGGIGWPGQALVLSADEIGRHIVEASGLTLVGELPDQVSDRTMAAPRDLRAAASTDELATGPGAGSPPVAVAGGYVFTMAHLLMRKTEESAMNSVPTAAPPMVSTTPEPGPLGTGPGAAGAGWTERVVGLQQRLSGLDELWRRGEEQIDWLSEADYQIGRTLTGLEAQRGAVETRLAGAATPPADVADDTVASTFVAQRAPAMTCCTVGLAEGLEFAVMVDSGSADPITTTFLTGYCLFQDLVSLMLQIVSPGEAVVDVGAHLGTFSLAAAAAGCPVLAIEASPLNVELLRASAARNGFHDVRVVSAAASDAPGSVQFCAIGPWGTVLNRPANALSIEVPAVTIDELMFELGFGPATFVKMDVEGSEIKALRGMAHQLSMDDAPALLLESNGHTLGLMGTTPTELLKEIEGFGYTAYMVSRDRLTPVTSAELQPRTEVDYLAVKRWPASLAAWDPSPPLTVEERVAMLVEDCRSESEDVRAYIGRAIADGGPEVLAHPDLAAALDRLADDPVGTVRGAVAWWPGQGQGPGQGGPKA